MSKKIIMSKDSQGLKKGETYNLSDMAASSMVALGVANFKDAPATAAASEPPTVTDKAPHKCNRKELDAIVAAEKVDIGEASTNVTIADAIVVHRENIIAAETVNDITTYLATRTECDETCRYADGDECTMPEDYGCPTQKEPDAE